MHNERLTFCARALLLVVSAMTTACPDNEASHPGADAAVDTVIDAGTQADASAPTSPVDASAQADAAAATSQADASAPRGTATHTGLVSVQDITIANLPAAGHSLTVNAFLTRLVAPDYEELPGQVTGCRAWAYDRVDKPPAAQEDHGLLTIDGVRGGPLACPFSSERGSYACPTLATPAPAPATEALVHDTGVTISLAPRADAAFDRVEAKLTPGAAFTLDDATSTAVQALPLDGQSVSLSCKECGTADVTIVRITTTDGDLTGASPVAMPLPRAKSVEIQCVALQGNTVVVPAAAMKVLADTHRLSPATRVRTAFMRDGLSLVTNQPPRAPNQLVLAVGRGVLGFTTPQQVP